MTDHPDRIVAKIRAVMNVAEVNPPAPEELIDDVQRGLGVIFPEWLREVYLACNGFRGPTGVRYLYSLDHPRDGVLSFTRVMRSEPWWPEWLQRAVIFSDNGIGGSLTVHWCALDGQLIEWCYGDAEAYQVLESDLYRLWEREQKRWDSVQS